MVNKILKEYNWILCDCYFYIFITHRMWEAAGRPPGNFTLSNLASILKSLDPPVYCIASIVISAFNDILFILGMLFLLIGCTVYIWWEYTSKENRSKFVACDLALSNYHKLPKILWWLNFSLIHQSTIPCGFKVTQ